ncbi:hypothetical protein F5Y01DRAFT_321761 [Xylaria sp. FL0043]|nr:hypothetical protein F5Y01DRAFT_321761 [Xylaria sp. FL0043]
MYKRPGPSVPSVTLSFDLFSLLVPSNLFLLSSPCHHSSRRIGSRLSAMVGGSKLPPTGRVPDGLMKKTKIQLEPENQSRGLLTDKKSVKTMKIERILYELQVPALLQPEMLGKLYAANMVDNDCLVSTLQNYLRDAGQEISHTLTKAEYIEAIIRYWVEAGDLSSMKPINKAILSDLKSKNPKPELNITPTSAVLPNPKPKANSTPVSAVLPTTPASPGASYVSPFESMPADMTRLPSSESLGASDLGTKSISASSSATDKEIEALEASLMQHYRNYCQDPSRYDTNVPPQPFSPGHYPLERHYNSDRKEDDRRDTKPDFDQPRGYWASSLQNLPQIYQKITRDIPKASRPQPVQCSLEPLAQQPQPPPVQQPRSQSPTVRTIQQLLQQPQYQSPSAEPFIQQLSPTIKPFIQQLQSPSLEPFIQQQSPREPQSQPLTVQPIIQQLQSPREHQSPTVTPLIQQQSPREPQSPTVTPVIQRLQSPRKSQSPTVKPFIQQLQSPQESQSPSAKLFIQQQSPREPQSPTVKPVIQQLQSPRESQSPTVKPFIQQLQSPQESQSPSAKLFIQQQFPQKAQSPTVKPFIQQLQSPRKSQSPTVKPVIQQLQSPTVKPFTRQQSPREPQSQPLTVEPIIQQLLQQHLQQPQSLSAEPFIQQKSPREPQPQPQPLRVEPIVQQLLQQPKYLQAEPPTAKYTVYSINNTFDALRSMAPQWLGLDTHPATLASIMQLSNYLDHLEQAQLLFTCPLGHRLSVPLHDTIRDDLLLPDPSVPRHIYRSPPSPEVDAAWNRLSHDGVIAVSEDEVRQAGKDPDILVKIPEDWGSNLCFDPFTTGTDDKAETVQAYSTVYIKYTV